MADPLALLAERLPDKPALVDDRPDGTLRVQGFAAFNAEVNRLAHVLRARGVRRGEKIVWWGMNSIGVARMMAAARKIGATAVPMNYRLAPEEAAYVVDNCDAVLVYVDADFAQVARDVRPLAPKVRDVLVFDGPAPPGCLDVQELMDAASDAEPEAEDSGEPAATMIYTSGTTGRPKGALRRGIGDPKQVQAMAEHIGYQPDDVYLTTGPLYHSGPGGFMTLSQLQGHTVVLQRRFDAEDWLRLVERYRVSTTFAAPAPIRLVCLLPEEVKRRYDASAMARLVANAAPWSWALKEMVLRDFGEECLFEVYGSTELGVNTILRPEDQRRKRGSCGKPAPGVEIVLFDDDGKRVDEPRVPGELYVRSRSVFQTYYKARDKYEADRRGDFQTVGDVAYFDDEGYYYICDRKKDMIISGGMNVYPAEIEDALEHHPDVVDVAVFGIPSEEWGESVHAVVVARPGSRIDEAVLRAFAREHLAGYKVPRSVSFADEIPRTGSGKILKRVLREPFWRGHESRVL
jgi:long-chain acyl-CoA synthetase